MLSFITWNPDPEIFRIGSLAVRWYGLIYATGFFVGITILGKMFKHDNAPDSWVDKVFVYIVLAVIIGARLGHVFFYDWEYYRENIGEIFKIWHGGLASHGGALMMVVACWLLSKYLTKQSIWWLGDRLFVPSALVACMIRIGNLMNSEIYGTPTDLPWGFVFLLGQEQFCGTVEAYSPCAAPSLCCPSTEWLPCHPTQLYEAAAYLLLFILMMWLYWKKDAGCFNGLLSGIGFTGVFMARQFIEILKNNQSAFESNMTFNMGQWLSVPFVILGILLIIHALKKGKVTYVLPQEKKPLTKKKP